MLSSHDLRATRFRVCREEKPVSTFSDQAPIHSEDQIDQYECPQRQQPILSRHLITNLCKSRDEEMISKLRNR